MNQDSRRTTAHRSFSSRIAWLVLGSVILLSGCAIDPGDSLPKIQTDIAGVTSIPMQLIQDQAQQQQLEKRVQRLLQNALTLDTAVEVAVLNNRAIQAELFGLGVSAAQLQLATQLPNPGIKLTRSTSDGSYSTELEFGLNLLTLITLPQIRHIEQQRFEQERLHTAQRIAALISETKIAYWNAVAAREVLTYIEQVHTTTQASAELAKRMLEAGNFNKLDYLREQGQLSDAMLNLVMARQAVYANTEKLHRLLGLWSVSHQMLLPDRLPTLPESVADLDNVAAGALEKRLDVQIATLKLRSIAATAGLTKATRFINAFEVEVAGNLHDSSERSYSAIFELPIFDWGNSRVKQAEAEYWQAFYTAAATGVNARSEIRESYLTYRSMYDLAAHYQNTVIPVQQQIAEENQLRYNGMFISVFELIADARSQISAVTGYVNAMRDFWVAKTQLDLALIGAPLATETAAANQPITSTKAAGH